MSRYLERHVAQVAHINRYIKKFRDHAGDRDVSEYLTDHAGPRHDIYQRLCFDLGIQADPTICHPDPYGDT